MADPPKRSHRKALRRLGYALLLLVALLAAFLGFLTTPPGERLLKGWAEESLSSALRTRVKIGSIETDLLSRLVLRDVRLEAGPPDHPDPFVRFSVGRVDYQPLAFLSKRWFVRNVRVEDLDAVLRRQEDGTWEWPFLRKSPGSPSQAPKPKGSGFQVDLQKVELARFKVRYDNEATGLRAAIEGPGGSLEKTGAGWKASMDLTQVRLQNQRGAVVDGQDQGRVEAVWSPEKIELERLALTLFGGKLSAQGTLYPGGVMRKFHLALADADAGTLAAFALGKKTPFEGRLSFDADLDGLVSKPHSLTSRGRLTLDDQTLGGDPLFTLNADWSLAQGRLALSASQGPNEILLRASLDRADRWSGLFTGSIADPGPPAGLLGIPNATGRLAATGDIRGSFSRPEADLVLSGDNVRLDGFPVDSLSGGLLLGTAGVTFRKVQVDGALRSPDPDHPLLGLKSWSGGFRYHAELDGPLSGPEASLRVDFTRPGFGGIKLDRAALRATIHRGELKLDLFKGQRDFVVAQAVGSHSLKKRTGSLTLSFLEVKTNKRKGRNDAGFDRLIPLEKLGPGRSENLELKWALQDSGGFRLEAQADSLKLDKVWALAPSAAQAEGLLGVRLVLQREPGVPHPGPLEVSGGVTLRDGAWQAQRDTAPVENLQAVVLLDKSRLVLQKLQGTVHGLALELKGSANLPGSRSERKWGLTLLADRREAATASGTFAPDRLELQVGLAKLPAQALEPFLPFFSGMGGELTGRFKISGTPSSPRLNGPLTVEDLSFFLPILNAKITQGNLTAAFNGQRLDLAESKLLFNGGPVTLQGGWDWGQGQEDFGVEANFAKVKVDLPHLLSGTIDTGRASWKSSEGGYLLEGDLDLASAKWQKDFAVSEPSSPPDLPPFLAQTRFSVRFRGTHDAYLDNNWGRIEVDADAALAGTWAAPTLLGQFQALGGKVFYLDRKFNVAEGSAQFNDATQVNPLLHLLAETTVRSYGLTGTPLDYSVVLSIDGPLDQMRLNLISDPVLDSADIVSLLTLGATRNQILVRNPGGPAAGDQIVSRAGSFTTNTLADYSARKVGRIIGLEDLSVEGNLWGAGGASTTDPRISATTRVSDRISVTYSTSAGRDLNQSVKVGYYLSNRFSVVTQAGQTGASSLDLSYRMLFK